jgi:hypothetical protein
MSITAPVALFAALVACLLVILSALAPSCDAAELHFPADLDTYLEKRDWMEQQFQQLTLAARAEMAKPRSQWSRATLAELAERGDALRALDHRSIGVLPPINEAREGLRILDEESAKQRRILDEEAARKKREAARLAAIRATGATATEEARILRGSVWIGMSMEQARLAWGSPKHVARTTTARGTTQDWSYVRGSLHFSVDGKLAVIHDSD